MEELKIAIEVLESEIVGLQNDVLEFCRFGRYPDSDEFYEMHDILDKRSRKCATLDELKGVLRSVEINSL